MQPLFQACLTDSPPSIIQALLLTFTSQQLNRLGPHHSIKLFRRIDNRLFEECVNEPGSQLTSQTIPSHDIVCTKPCSGLPGDYLKEARISYKTGGAQLRSPSISRFNGNTLAHPRRIRPISVVGHYNSLRSSNYTWVPLDSQTAAVCTWKSIYTGVILLTSSPGRNSRYRTHTPNTFISFCTEVCSECPCFGRRRASKGNCRIFIDKYRKLTQVLQHRVFRIPQLDRWHIMTSGRRYVEEMRKADDILSSDLATEAVCYLAFYLHFL